MAAGVSLAGTTGMIAGGLIVPSGLMWWERRHTQRARRRQESDVIEACLALAVELGSGAPAHQALAVQARVWPDLFASVAVRRHLGVTRCGCFGTVLANPALKP
jgi:uncharacterized iron-regulated membrane protein